MIIYFCLFIPLLFLPTDSSSIRGTNHKNDLVPFLSTRMDTAKKDPNSVKIVSKDPFIIQLHTPFKDMEARGGKEKDKKRKRPMKKRVSKIKPLRKKHRKRRDLLTSKTKPREEKLFRFKIPRAANETENQLKNNTKNSVSRMEILKALHSYPKKTETKRNKLEGIRNTKDEEKINAGTLKKNNASNRNRLKHQLSLSDRSKVSYPSTPKLDRRPQKYTYKDLMADRERLEQKIKYIKNMLSYNDSTTDDAVRVRRRSDSDRTANKIAKMFLTLSAVNGLHDKKKSKCNDEDYDDDRAEDNWEKERRNNPFRKSLSSNEERYKVKKWIEFMKSKRSSGKTCPCMSNNYGEEGDVFPLEQKLPKGYFLLERGRSSEESSELYGDPLYYSKDKINRNDNVKKRLSKSQDQDGKNKALNKNGKRKLEMPFEDLELYRSRARQILQNAEEILDKIKEEEEKRLAAPNILLSQLKELTARIHGDPRNNENDLIRKIQKNLGWGPLARPQENEDGTFLDNVKSFILDPYEKAKALTDESTKKLSSYLLRNLGRIQESSEEQEIRNSDDKNDDGALKIYFGEVPHTEEKPPSADLAKEEPKVDGLSKDNENLQNWEDTLSAILGGDGDAINKESDWDANREESSPQKIEELIQETQKTLNDFKEESKKETEVTNNTKPTETPPAEDGFVAESKPESILEEEKVAMTPNEKSTDENNHDTTESHLTTEKSIQTVKESAATTEKETNDSDIVKSQPFHEMEGTFQGKEGESNVTPSGDMQEEEEFEKEIEEIIKSALDKEDKENNDEDLKTDEEVVQNPKTEGDEEVVRNPKTEGDEEVVQNPKTEGDEEVVQNPKTEGDEEKATKEDIVDEALDKQEENEKEDEKVSITLLPEVERKSEDFITEETVGRKSDDLPSDIYILEEASPKTSEVGTTIETQQNSKETVKANLEDEFETDEEPVLEKQQELVSKQNEDQLKVEENKSESIKDGDLESEKESPLTSEELLKESKAEDSLNEEIIQEDNIVKEPPEQADLVQEARQSSKEFSESNPKLEDSHKSSEILEDASKTEKEETLEPDDEENQAKDTITKESADDETLKAVLGNDNNGEDMEAGKIQSISREESTEDQDPPLRATLDKQENSNEPLDVSLPKESDDYAFLKETNSEDQKNEAVEEDNDDETVKETLEIDNQEILDEEKNHETSSPMEKQTEDMDDQEKVKSTQNDNDEAILKESKPDEKVSVNEEERDEDTPLKAVMSNQESVENADEKNNGNSEVNEEDKNLEKEDSEEINLEASLDKNEDTEDGDETTLQAKSPNYDEEEETKNVDEDQEKNSAKSTEDVGSQKENLEKDVEGSSETLEKVLDTQESADKETEEGTTSNENKNTEITSEKNDDETIVRAETPDEIIEDKDTSQELLKSSGDEEIENPKENNSEETLREANPDENVEDERSSLETLKAIQDNQKDESAPAGEDEMDKVNLSSSNPLEDENVKAALENETEQENMEENPEEILKAVEVDDQLEERQEETSQEATLGNQDDELKSDETLKETNIGEPVENFEKNDNEEVDNQKQTDEIGQNLNEDESKNEEGADDEKIMLTAKSFEEEVNNQNSNDETQKEVSSAQEQEKLEESYENVQAENPEEGEEEEEEEDDETSLRSASIEDEFDNKIEYETPLKSVKSVEEADDDVYTKNAYENESEEIQQPQNLGNQINEDDEAEDILKLTHLNESPESLGESTHETIGGEHLEAESLLKAKNEEIENEQNDLKDGIFNVLGDIKKHEDPSKSLKASKLKVPESIGKIMKDLDGKDKSDITSIQNLNPDKIDHMLDKIDKAEQQNLLESEEVDCVKECACAEEMNTRSRNIGRYEIVKDFLQWVKDLQLNRVLSDD